MNSTVIALSLSKDFLETDSLNLGKELKFPGAIWASYHEKREGSRSRVKCRGLAVGGGVATTPGAKSTMDHSFCLQ